MLSNGCEGTSMTGLMMRRWWLVASFAVAGAAYAQKVQPAPSRYDEELKKLGDGLTENMAIRDVHFAKTDDRKHKRFYTEQWDLSATPEYKPSKQFTGTIRVSGNYLVEGTIADQWKQDFERLQPGVKVEMVQEGEVATGDVQIETGPRMKDRLRQASEFEDKLKRSVFDVEWATGSYDVPGWSPGFVIFVQKDNPIAHLSLAQLDGIFGGAHTGGWDGTTWRTDSARGPEKNIRTWGQLGLTGEWADKPIHIYGRPLKYNIQLGFERKVFHGGDVWNENTLEYSHEMNPDGSRYSSSPEMVKDMGNDPYGICFADEASMIPTARAVPVGSTDAGPFMPITLNSLHDRSYPLFIEEWAEVSVAPGKPLDPLTKEFLTFMLSRQGQDAVQKDGKWIPIPSDVSKAAIAKLNEPGKVVRAGKLGLQDAMLAPAKWMGDSPDETGKVNAKKAYYTKRWDLSDLPAYDATTQVTGTIRMPASGLIMASTVGQAWMDGFRKQQPGVTFVKQDGELIDKKVDLELGRKWSSYFAGETLQFQLKYKHSAREIQIGTGSYDVPGYSPAFAIYVNKSNPVTGLTMEQLDGIFGGPRRGGWVSTAFRRQVGRTSEKNIRTWGQAGAPGAWASQPIDVIVPPLKYHIMTVFERKVLEGGNMWNDSIKEYPLLLKADGTRNVPSEERIKRVGMDKDAITFSQEGFPAGQAKALPLAATDGGPFVPPTLENVRNRSYPLSLELYAYADQQPDKPMDPVTKEFLRYILSREGQDMLQRDGKWLPLTAEMVKEQREKLDMVIPPFKNPGTKAKAKAAAGAQ
ncbi:hypothetical protein AciX9_0515 [Granulicella tundricola MP5ACTX9]|uniref:PBP domain-containing protein n=1 Tax=Granulicella tundricola (strain ATCC BAA-1859 / DSM 23138 / MP5ACTX9) TaxID=1198114 RepID=E8WYI9_GRATM|nr:hypothetical protein AciX9_0515 [Granulicella tundricola MP5ACTX9]